MRSPDRGVIYTAIRKKYVREAQLSAQSVRAFLPDVGIVLFTDCPPKLKGVFDNIVHLTKLNPVPHLDKLICMRDSPFKKTLFLDTDTYVCGPLDGLFELLKDFDIAMALERRYHDILPEGVGVPAAFCEFNQGVVAFRQSDQMKKMLQASLHWAENYYARVGTPTNDQVAMRIGLYFSGLRIATLPQEFNCRFHSFGYLNGKVKILHARIPGGKHTEKNLQTIVGKINREAIPRVFVAGKVYALKRRRFLSVEHTFSKKSATLFRPWRVLCKTLLQRIMKKVERRIQRLVKASTRLMTHLLAMRSE
jgi:hypothetical protein